MARFWVVFSLALALCVHPATACSQMGWTPEGEYEDAEFIFMAYVDSVETFDIPKDFSLYDGDFLKFTRINYRVLEAIKGHPPEAGWIMNWSGYNGGCGLFVAAGMPHIFSVLALDDELKSIPGAQGAIGWASLRGSTALNPNPERMKEEADKIRKAKAVWLDSSE